MQTDDKMQRWRLVPVEPTEAMHVAARDWSDRKYGKPIGFDASAGCWSAMLAAAPQRDDLYTRIATLLSNDPICGGRITGDTIDAIVEMVGGVR